MDGRAPKLHSAPIKPILFRKLGLHLKIAALILEFKIDIQSGPFSVSYSVSLLMHFVGRLLMSTARVLSI